MRLAMISSAVIAAAGALVLGVWSHGLAAPPAVPRLAQLERPPADVDVELVLAVDVSYSMDPDEQALQREGYVAALTSPEFLGALRHVINGRIALAFASPLFGTAGHHGVRRVIDVSGDGANNQGKLIVPTREEVLAQGITINGLPIMLKRPNPNTLDIEELDVYYEDCVIGGPGSFVIPIRERDKFKEATRQKLILEVAGLTPAAPIVR